MNDTGTLYVFTNQGDVEDVLGRVEQFVKGMLSDDNSDFEEDDNWWDEMIEEFTFSIPAFDHAEKDEPATTSKHVTNFDPEKEWIYEAAIASFASRMRIRAADQRTVLTIGEGVGPCAHKYRGLYVTYPAGSVADLSEFWSGVRAIETYTEVNGKPKNLVAEIAKLDEDLDKARRRIASLEATIGMARSAMNRALEG